MHPGTGVAALAPKVGMLLAVACVLAGCVSMPADLADGMRVEAAAAAPAGVQLGVPESAEDPNAAQSVERRPAPPEPAAEEAGPVDPVALNPLTGTPVEDPASLSRRPILVAISNFPPSAREVQSGLSLASQVWETYIGQGMTRYLVLFYGDYVQQLSEILGNRLGEGGDGFVIGPVRSGRVEFEDIKTLFPRSLLITAGASEEVKEQLSNRISVYSDDPESTQAAGIGTQDLEALAATQVDPLDYAGLTFDPLPPPRGAPAPLVRILHNRHNQIGWTYDAERGEFLRSQDRADGSEALLPTLDHLTGEQVGASNVLVLFAQHRFVNSARTIVEMELVYVRDRKGLLLRDGLVYPIRWSTMGGQLQVMDEEGTPMPLQPGLSWFEVVSYESTWDEEELVIRFHNPPGP